MVVSPCPCYSGGRTQKQSGDAVDEWIASTATNTSENNASSILDVGIRDIGRMVV